MAGGRRWERRRGRQSGSGEHTQPQRNEVHCSNHDATHRLILSRGGKVSEHWAKAPANYSKTRLVKELGSLNIVQIACGDQHAMALSRGGELFTWGQNTHGQLGLGSQTAFIPQAQLVERLKGIPLAQIAAGGAHSTTVSLSGAVYSWGKNDFGQLGLGDTEDRDCPSYVGALEHWKTVFISCGAGHTAALSKEGLVCTFGAGGAGQLGHNSTRNELMPRVVAELWGARVSRVACGRQHTLVYVPSLDKFYFFGSDDEGQPEDERKPNQLIPLPINSPVNTGNSCQKNNKSQKGIKITAAVKRSFALCKENQNSYWNGIATLENTKVDDWISNFSSKVQFERIKKNIRLIFSSETCINGSFLQKRDKHFKTSKEFSGVDMSKVNHFYKKISEKPELFQEVQKEIDNLLPSLTSSPISPENFRVYLILPFILQGEDKSCYHSLRLLAQAIMKLQAKDLQTLECLWSNLETSFFKKLVILYQRVSEEILSQFITAFCTCGPRDLYLDEAASLRILQMLYQVNSRTGFRVEERNFHVPLVKMVIHFFDREIALRKLSKYPCIFDTQDKIAVLTAECKIMSTEGSTLSRTSSNIMGEQWEFHIRRQCFLQDIWNNLECASTQEFRKTLKVVFVGEQGVDEGGLSQELFSIAARTLCQPGTSAFRHCTSGLVWFPSKVSGCEDKDTFFQIGTLCGMALFNQRMMPFPFPRALYKKLLDLAPTLEDLEELLPTTGRILWGILNEECDHILESMDIDFTIMEEGDSMDVVELKKNGANIPVTKDNRKEYVGLYVNYVFNESVQKPFQDFMQGFLRGCPARNWKMFLPAELQVVLQGHPTVDWHLLEKNVVYMWYNKSDKTIKDFWNVFHKLPEEKKKMFLGFLSGSDRIPGYRLEWFRFSIVDPQVENPDELYPSASTCSLIFYLPRYSSKSILKEKLLYAIEHNEGFGCA
ncbi:probable E3 ubiquitin-protein ligase HERC4 [Neopelma chrysocephalum]|uniref:probable E3 ubiquitin-protein ligase HERC4 n=1 Tax=Neopelma chrysocephalum TaxID=114329 RepID=UPI000FCD2A64|nr:probable E3 ubiquitin-protein ligase HERC4 [Neopelma chrysocephalum]